MCGSPENAAEALAAVQAGYRYLATVPAAGLTTAEQADCLRGLATAGSMHLAATTSVLGAFDAAGGCTADGQISSRAWLRWQTRISPAAAGASTAWLRRLRAHPAVGAALAEGRISASFAREICDWTGRLPTYEQTADADQILLGAAAGGSELADLAGLAEEIYRRCGRPNGDDGDDGFAQRRVRLTRHFQGYARLDGDLTPQAAAAVQAVFDSLGKKAGPEDLRSRDQRSHDALEEACRRLTAIGLPDRAGQPTQIQLQMTLPQLLGLPGAPEAITAWAGTALAPAPPGADCDATIAPMVTGTVDQDILDEIAAAILPGTGSSPATRDMAGRAARQAAISWATRLLSGPDGLAGWLRRSLLTGPAGSISLPLDLGTETDTIPAHLRRAVIRRDQHCTFAGCLQPPQACQVHHLTPRSQGGPTSLQNCGLACTFHHLIAIHRWGWKLVLNPDGTRTTISPDGTRTYRSHTAPTAA
jgi:Domain of unknown function (DUF222)/HNH endonuclease